MKLVPEKFNARIPLGRQVVIDKETARQIAVKLMPLLVIRII
jgi:hypothetical protein